MNIVYAGLFHFTSSEANALRVRGVARALSAGGASVTIVGAAAPGSEAALEEDEEFPSHSVDEYGQGLLSSLPRGARGILTGDVSAARVRSLRTAPDCVIVTGVRPGYYLRFRKLSRQLSIPLVLDVMEWFAPEDQPGGRFGPYTCANEIGMRVLARGADGIIVLSSRLEEHFAGQGCRTLNVPPLFVPLGELRAKHSTADRRLHLCYAGTPGRKEALNVIVPGLIALQAKGIDFVLHFVGLTREEFQRAAPSAGIASIESIAARIHFYGRVPNDSAREIVAAADFTLLVRPLRKSNQFGFPSKLPESMSLGTPVIANDFSDLGRYLVDGENAITVQDLSVDALVTALERAARMDQRERAAMSTAAIRLARSSFSPEAHANALAGFIASLRRNSPDGNRRPKLRR